HLPKLRLKFGSIRGALHFKSLCNKAVWRTNSDLIQIEQILKISNISMAQNLQLYQAQQAAG
ncbi:hypothetical protein B4S22_01485, partial [Acinetobacter baumannii]|uniref:hypothetical protein n=1 Tax=Acinetobacter pittii TaxID=48296 RepID=UPI000B65844A